MSLDIAPTTELQAVNEMLTAIGTTPVETLGEPGLTDASIALETLSGVNREVQARGWWFNRGYGVTVSLSGAWTVPNNMISLRPARGSFATVGESKRFVMRQRKLFDLNTNSNIETGSVKADVIYLWDFEELPEAARRYITVRAARIFQTKVLGDDQQGVFNEDHEMEAWDLLITQQNDSEPGSTLFTQRAASRFAAVRLPPRQVQQGGRRGG